VSATANLTSRAPAALDENTPTRDVDVVDHAVDSNRKIYLPSDSVTPSTSPSRRAHPRRILHRKTGTESRLAFHDTSQRRWGTKRTSRFRRRPRLCIDATNRNSIRFNSIQRDATRSVPAPTPVGAFPRRRAPVAPARPSGASVSL